MTTFLDTINYIDMYDLYQLESQTDFALWVLRGYNFSNSIYFYFPTSALTVYDISITRR